MVDTPGGACHLASHRDGGPRVDGGPTSPDEVPLSDATGLMGAGAALGKALAAVVVLYLGLGRFLSGVVVHGAAIFTAVALALALDAYQRRALRDGDSSGGD